MAAFVEKLFETFCNFPLASLYVDQLLPTESLEFLNEVLDPEPSVP